MDTQSSTSTSAYACISSNARPHPEVEAGQLFSPPTLEGVRTAIGLLAAALTTGAWLPQIARTLRTRSSEDISWAYLVAMFLGFTAWLTYGVLHGESAIIAANDVSLLLVGRLEVLQAKTSGRILQDGDPAR